MNRNIVRAGVLALVIGLCLTGACRKPGATTTQPSEASYDPTKDPIVNPPSLFEPAPQDRSRIATDETLYYCLEASPRTLNPLFISSQYEFTLSEVLDMGLCTWDNKLTWRPNEEIVEFYEESEDHTTFIVRIKPGFTWHDGAPFTVHDIVYSWQQILDPQVPCQMQKSSVEPIKECVALDDRTVKFVQPEPLATAHWNIHFPIVPKHLFEKGKAANPDLKTGPYYNQLARQPVSAGPYRLVEWKDNDRIVVERWDDYAGTKPYFKRIVFRIIPDHSVGLLSFEKQDVDFLRRLTAQQFARETSSETFRQIGHKAWGPQWAFAYIGWNMDGSNPFFNDRDVRYAMTHALNIPLILDKVWYNLATPCLGVYHPDSWMFNPEVKPLEYDLARSANYLDKAGWKINPADGWRYKMIDGTNVKFEFTLLIPQGSSTGPKIAAIFQEDLKRLGVLLKTRIIEWAAFMDATQKHEFQAQTAMWGTGTDPDTGWNLWRTEEYERGRNYGGYSDPRIDELFEQGRREFDPDARRKIYQEIHKILYDDQPYTWVYNEPVLSAMNRRIRGAQLSPRGLTGFDPGFLGWWVPASKTERAAAMP